MDRVVVVRSNALPPLPLLGVPGARAQTGGAVALEREGPGGARRIVRVLPAASADGAVAVVGRGADVLVLDARGGGLPLCREAHERLFGRGALSGPVLPDRTIAVVDPGPEGASAAFELGRRGVGQVLVAPELHELFARVDAMLAGRGRGRIALCLAGGGIEGLLWELGVLRALEACLVDRSLVDVDFFCGISAGSILGALLANGIGPDEILRALTGQGSARLEPIRRYELFDPDVAEVARRLAGLIRELLRGGAGPRGAVSSLARAVPPAVFAGKRLERWLERQLTSPGMSNRFSGLRRPLYVGATDQDTSEAMLFSAKATPEVPVHLAARASSALVPFYAPVRIGNRWYIDGAFSRTTNMRVAVDEGATLVILVDPLVPVRAPTPGHVRARGGIYGTMQGLKALINGRFDKAVHAIRAMYPDVAFHLFRPEQDDMRVLAGSPMKVFYRREIEDIAYRTTLEQIATQHPTLSRDFALHGVRFRLPASAPRQVVPQDEEERALFDLEALGIEPGHVG
ncbi:PNPLA domain-containing protein [Sandaracinus amylolyticus]|nr:PNPLA domain-containing protein [Sandaracinus amylolyticus]